MRKLLLSLVSFPLITTAGGPDTYKAVFDCAVGDLDWISARLSLIKKTAESLIREGKDYRFALTIHSHCIYIVEKNLKRFSEKKAKKIAFIQSQLQTLKELYNVEVKACDIALRRGKIKSMPSFIEKVPNSWITLIELQNKGYAFVPF
ncbi:DsrE family protein [Hydrogenivirga sp.]